MSEEITEKEEFIKIVSILSFSDVHLADCKYITHFIIDLAKENQQLNNTNIQLSTLNTNLRSTRDNYKSVLDEIREYITKELDEPDPEYYCEYTVDISWFTELLQILDKVKE